MKLNFEKKENIIIVHLEGRFDVYVSEEHEKAISLLLADELSSHLILELQAVEYLTSSGIGMFVTIMNKLKQRERKMAICGLNEIVAKILEVVEMAEFFPVFKNEDEAFEFLVKQ